jgi:hypothetical protein
MAINWTSIITNGASLTVILIAIWKGSRVLEQAIRESAISKSDAERKSKAQQERISTLENIAEIQGGRLDDIEYHLAKNPEEKEVFYPRRAMPNLEKKAFRKYGKIDTDFT